MKTCDPAIVALPQTDSFMFDIERLKMPLMLLVGKMEMKKTPAERVSPNKSLEAPRVRSWILSWHFGMVAGRWLSSHASFQASNRARLVGSSWR